MTLSVPRALTVDLEPRPAVVWTTIRQPQSLVQLFNWSASAIARAPSCDARAAHRIQGLARMSALHPSAATLALTGSEYETRSALPAPWGPSDTGSRSWFLPVRRRSVGNSLASSASRLWPTFSGSGRGDNGDHTGALAFRSGLAGWAFGLRGENGAASSFPLSLFQIAQQRLRRLSHGPKLTPGRLVESFKLSQ